MLDLYWQDTCPWGTALNVAMSWGQLIMNTTDNTMSLKTQRWVMGCPEDIFWLRESFLLRIDSLLCSMCDTVQLVPIRCFFLFVFLFFCLFVCLFVWRTSHGRVFKTLDKRVGDGGCLWVRPAFETGLRLVKQFAHNWNLLCCQFTETCCYASSMQSDTTDNIMSWVLRCGGDTGFWILQIKMKILLNIFDALSTYYYEYYRWR